MKDHKLCGGVAVALSALFMLGIAGQHSPAHLDQALQRIDRQQLINLTQRLVQIPSEYSEGRLANHREISAFIADELRRMGLEVTVLEPTPHYPLVVGRLRGTRGTPKLGAMGHYNTVPAGDRSKWTVDPFAATIKNGRLYGRGAGDQKAGIAALLAATRAIVESGIRLRGDLVHVYLPGEGAQSHVLPQVVDTHRNLLKTDWYIDTDGGRDIIQVAAGHLWIRLTTRGKSAHPGGDRPWINAANKLVHVLSAIENPDAWMTYERHPLLAGLGGKPRVHVGTIRAGESVNSIPDTAEAQVDIRLNPGQTLEGVLRELNTLLATLKGADPELDVSIDQLPGTQHVPSHYWAAITPDESLIKVIRQVAGARLGREPGFIGSRAGGRPDIWRLGSTWISWSANTVGNEHAPDEWTDLENLQKAAAVYVEIFLRILE